MFRFGLKNIRRLKSVDPIELRRITLLVGRNSSGKSTFLRTLPLLRQSILTKTSSPILWFGDYVDFGSFQNAVSSNDEGKTISLQFEIDDVNVRLGTRFSHRGVFGEKRTYNNVHLSMAFQPYGARTISAIKLSLDEEDHFEMFLGTEADLRRVTLNGEDVSSLYKGWEIYLSHQSFFPEVVVVAREGTRKQAAPFMPGRSTALVSEPLPNRLRELVPDEMPDEEVSDFIGTLLGLPDLTEHTLVRAASVLQSGWRNALYEIIENQHTEAFAQLRKIWRVNAALPVLEEVSRRLRRILTEVLYIGPARASSQRYYRYQDLAISGIDPDGKNFPMFLNSLGEDQIDSFSDWVERLFGYRVVVSPIPGHISIELSDGVAKTNIVDTGYGVSQVLPVLGQIWWASNKQWSGNLFQNDGASIVAIEQPELHLHPAHQALLADALAEPPTPSYAPESSKPSFIVETHSETLVNRLGQLVGEGRLKPSDVQIVLFEPDDLDSRQTNVSISRYGDQGQLLDWPYGFFQSPI